MEEYTIPRGIKVKETMAYGLNGKQILYLGSGFILGLGIFSLPLPLDLKIAGAILSSVLALMLSLAKRHGQELDAYLMNSVKYPFRNKEWSEGDEKAGTITIRFHARQSHTA